MRLARAGAGSRLSSPPTAAADALRPPWTPARRRLTVALSALVVAAGWAIGRTQLSFGELAGGLGDIGNLLGRMLPPRFDAFGDTLRLAAETFWIALAGTFLAAVLALPLSFLHARTTTPHRLVRAAAGAVIVGCRSIPDIVFALIFVRALSIGALPGVLAIAVHSVGMIGKLFAEAIERIDEGPSEAVLSTGASSVQRLSSGVLPQVVPSFVATLLYRLDINIRGSVILGYVGAGGIGVALRANFGKLDYPNAMGIVMVIGVIVIGCELLASVVRQAVIGPDASGGLQRPNALTHRGAHVVTTFDRVRLRPPRGPERTRLRWFAVLGLSLVGIAFWQIELSPGRLVGAVPKILRMSTQFFPLDFTTARSAMLSGMVDTVAIALAATALGALVAIPVGLLAARNVAPRREVYLVVRYALVIWRAIPELAVAIVFVAAVGLGPFPGVMALAIGSFGFVAKLVADATEEIQRGPREAVMSTGASRLQESVSAVLPQSMPAIAGAVLYAIDVNIRSAAVLGVVGAGGIGFLLNRSLSGLEYRVTGAILVMTFGAVLIVEQLSAWIRRSLR